jgi:uncharacterized protein with PIN domain
MECKEELEALRDRIRVLEQMAHPKKKFVVCEECKQQIKELINGDNSK